MSMDRKRPLWPALLVVILFSMLLVACGGAAAPAVAEVQLIGPENYQEQFDQNTQHALIDVRTPEEFSEGHIPGAVNISVQTLPERLDEVPGDLPVVVYCRSGNRSATAAQILVENGYQPVYDLGGIKDWIAQGYAIEY